MIAVLEQVLKLCFKLCLVDVVLDVVCQTEVCSRHSTELLAMEWLSKSLCVHKNWNQSLCVHKIWNQHLFLIQKENN